MPDGNLSIDERGFEPLTETTLATFLGSARGELRERLQIAPPVVGGNDAWLYRRAGLIRGIGALEPVSPWHWMLWSFPGELNLGDWKRVMRFTRLRVARKFADHGATRVSATARCGVLEASRFLEALSFEVEGVMRCYGPGGEAHWLYAIVHPPQEAAHG